MFGRGKGNANVYSGPVAVWARRGRGGGRSHVMRFCAPRVQGQGVTVSVSDVWVCVSSVWCVSVCVCAAPLSLYLCRGETCLTQRQRAGRRRLALPAKGTSRARSQRDHTESAPPRRARGRAGAAGLRAAARRGLRNRGLRARRKRER